MSTFIKLFSFVVLACAAVVCQTVVLPPANAVVFYPVQQTSNWGMCNAADCAGGSGNGTYSMTQYVGSPSLSGESTELYIDGAWEDALWFKKFGSGYENATHMLWDFYFQIDSAAQQGAQALEFDQFQFLAGYNYMVGSQCNVAGGALWDVWDELEGRWIHTTIPCQLPTPNVWHHVTWYITTDHTAHTYTYKYLIVDGVYHTVNLTHNAKNIGWDHNIGCQWQLDETAAGHPYHEWFDNAKLTVW
jgi:hypothetical protein